MHFVMLSGETKLMFQHFPRNYLGEHSCVSKGLMWPFLLLCHKISLGNSPAWHPLDIYKGDSSSGLPKTDPRFSHLPTQSQAAWANCSSPLQGTNEQRRGNSYQKKERVEQGPLEDFIWLLISTDFVTSAQMSFQCLLSSLCCHGRVEHLSHPSFPDKTHDCADLGAKEATLKHSSTNNGNLL